MSSENVVEMFEARAREFAGRVAVERADKSVTYDELDANSNSLANYLIETGLRQGSPVAILAEDAILAITGILGILKAGGAFVPLDPTMPEKRLETMVSVVKPPLFLVESKFTQLARRVAEGAGVNPGVICADHAAEPRSDGDGGASHECESDFATYFNPRRPGVRLDPEGFCYVYFTSGSTGTPKAIAGRLKGIDHFIRWETKTLGVDDRTRVSQLLAYSFDGSLRDIFVPLCSGGTVCVPPRRDTILDAGQLVAWLDEQRVQIIHCVPSLFRAIINEGLRPEQLRALRYILMAGEPLLPSDVKRWMEVFGERVQLVNLYGTSETTMAKFIYFVRATDAERRSISVGKPMEGAAAMILDARGRPSPRGTIGEIYIRTPYRSLGYYNQPELTKEVFIQNPFSDDPNDIVYKTGDLGRVLEDGNFEYLGRQDQQIKIRGMRVELEEVESVLRDHSSVKDLAVVDREDASGFKYLCAYVVLSDEAGVGKLREHAETYLPDYMVPSAFIMMDELPRTISGKIDRRALPTALAATTGREESYLAPRTPTEELLCAVFSQVLGLSRIGVHDNFFHAGGHSLSATQVVSRARSLLRTDITLRDLFEAPTAEALASRLTARGTQSSAAAVEAPLALSREGEPLLTSYAQRRLWFIEQLEPGTAAYNVPAAVRLRGRLDADALEESLREVVRRHGSLRTTFTSEDGEPRQIVHPDDGWQWTMRRISVKEMDEAEREEEARRVAAVEAERPFDLSGVESLLRATLISMSEEEHVLVLVMHHIISDGWSLGVLVGEVTALYGARVEGRESGLEELGIQYADYARWQREWLSGGALEEQMKYWRERLRDAAPALELPTDRARAAVLSYRGATQSFAVGAEVAGRLRGLGRREGATLFMTLLAAFDVLLWRYTGQDDIVVGTPIAGRNRAEIENLIGFFVNTLVLRSDLSGDPTFLELLKRVRETALGAYAHQDLPFEKLVEELQPERSLSHHPLFQVMFVLQNAPLGEVKLPGLSLSPLGNERPVAKFDLNLHFGETEDGLVGHLYYNRDLFDASTAEQIVSHYKNLLQAVAMSPEARLSRLPLMSDAEREQVVVAWNRTEADYPLSRGIHRLFEEQAEKIPDAPALVFEDERLDYRELNERANRLAHHLSALGVGPETLVGIYLERSVEMVVSLLAILKAGGAYLGLDPTQPAERVAFMMEDARVRAVITNSALRDSLPGHHASVVSLDEEAEQIAARPATNIKVEVWPESLAYVIYTSGSTGRPKGVIGGHRQLLNYLYGITERLRLQPRGSFAMHQTLSVDAPITYLFAALCRGGVLHIISEERAADGDALGDYFRLHDIDYFKVAPSHLAALQASRQPERIMPGRLLLIGGEAARPEWVEAARALAPDCVIVNHYGPTETTVGVLTYQANGTNGAHATPILPLGRPLGNAEIYILDADLNPVPVGVPGELHIGGVGLARGYLNRPELTAERFIPHPFGRSGMRLYKSGDLARFLPDGTVEFLGRLDHQVKVRGFRVELEEIEAVLSEHPRVRAVAVLAHEQAAGDNRLYAYAVLDGELTTDELRWFAQERLPEHMVPSAFMLLDELPRTPQGKIDRRALPSPEQFRREPGEEFVAPRTPTEEKVAEMWSELLGVERVGVNDNFFELGGHSLLATQLVSRLRQTFRIELPLRALFETPTVAATATAVDALTERPEAMAAAAISPLSRNARRVKQSELKEEVR